MRRKERRTQPIERRILALYIPGGEDECWEWVGKKRPDGYGIIWGGKKEGRDFRAHRIMYELHIGEIPDGLVLHHLCENRGCVNPRHLEPTTIGENVNLSSITNAGKTHCKRGHEFTPENTYVKANGWRNCRTCHRLYERARRLPKAT